MLLLWNIQFKSVLTEKVFGTYSIIFFFQLFYSKIAQFLIKTDFFFEIICEKVNRLHILEKKFFEKNLLLKIKWGFFVISINYFWPKLLV